jgi:hypothetical protein
LHLEILPAAATRPHQGPPREAADTPPADPSAATFDARPELIT